MCNHLYYQKGRNCGEKVCFKRRFFHSLFPKKGCSMQLNYNIDTSSHDGRLRAEALKGFLYNYDQVNSAGPVIKFSDKDFKAHGIPSPRQYIAWRKLINMIGEENFSRLPLELVKLSNLEILLVDKFGSLFRADQIEPNSDVIKKHLKHDRDKQLKVTFACGYFWRTFKERRNKMKKFIRDNILANGWEVEILTQDGSLKNELGKHENLTVRHVLHRIDVHYIIVNNEVSPEKSYIFLELPHSEAFYFRLDTYFPFEQIKNFSNCSKDDFLNFLKNMCRWDIFGKSLPSKLNFAINRK